MSTTQLILPRKNKFLTLAWLLVAVIMVVAWLVIWLSDAPKTTKRTQGQQMTQETVSLPKSINKLTELTKEVAPIDFETVVRDLRNYPEQFKDKKFFDKHQKKWTVQVMDVTQHDIITEYLRWRDDKDKFAYFRYHDSNDELRYILTYGVMGSTQEALGAIKTVNFGLKNIQPMPEQMKRYVDLIDNYERTEVVVDLSRNGPRAIILRETKQEIPAQPKIDTPKPKPALANPLASNNGKSSGAVASGQAEPTPITPHPPVIEQPVRQPVAKQEPFPYVVDSTAVEYEAKPAQKSNFEPPVSYSATPDTNTSKTPGSHE